MGIWPNPVTQGIIHINTSAEIRRIRLIDVSGKTVLVQELRGTVNTLRVGQVAAGLYFLWVETETGSTVQKILIK